MNSYFLNNLSSLLNSKCNIEQIDIYTNLGKDKILQDIDRYINSIKNQTNYTSVSHLEEWKQPDNQPHVFHETIAEFCNIENCKNVLDAGSGAGIVAKHVYNKNPHINLTCVEASQVHYNQMIENFDTKYNIIPPFIKVNARTFNQSLHNLQFNDNEFDLVYTCTVMMHIPYIPAVGIMCELARVTSKYILHIENLTACTHLGEMHEEFENTRSINYKEVYEQLGFITIMNVFGPDPNTHHNYYIYLGLKKTNS